MNPAKYYGNPAVPLGIRNNNPGNIEWGDPWNGLDPSKGLKNGRFCQFLDPVMGIRALACTLTTYYDKRVATDGSKIDTVTEIIERWAPAADANNTQAYIADVAARAGFGATQTIDLHDFATMRAIVCAIIRHENGPGPLSSSNSWYPAEVIDEGLRRAGIAPPKTVAGSRTTAATVSAGLGVTQLADIAGSVQNAMASAHGDISSGDWVRIAFGLGAIAVAGYLAWAQYRKHQAGAS